MPKLVPKSDPQSGFKSGPDVASDAVPNGVYVRAPGQRTFDQAGSPANRLTNEDGGALPRIPLHAPPSSPSQSYAGRSPSPVSVSKATWTLGELHDECDGVIGDRDITQLPLDVAGVHEIKPAFQFETAKEPDQARIDWAASWSAARAFGLRLIARRLEGWRLEEWRLEGRRIEDYRVEGCDGAPAPVLWCMPRSARTEHGALYSHGLKDLGLDPANVLIVETGNIQDTLWTLEEGLKSESFVLVAGIIDDITLTPARRLALATQKHNTPCLLFTHPRMPPVGATTSRWRVAARPGAAHPLGAQSLCAQHQVPRDGARFKAPGARRFALTLERYRQEPGYVTGREVVVEWSDEAVCMRLVPNLSGRPHASRVVRSERRGIGQWRSA